MRATDASEYLSSLREFHVSSGSISENGKPDHPREFNDEKWSPGSMSHRNVELHRCSSFELTGAVHTVGLLHDTGWPKQFDIMYYFQKRKKINFRMMIWSNQTEFGDRKFDIRCVLCALMFCNCIRNTVSVPTIRGWRSPGMDGLKAFLCFILQ